MSWSEVPEEAAAVCGEGISEGGKAKAAPPPALRSPAHPIARVFSQLDCVDLLNCSLVCNDSAELREGWKNEYLEAWNQYGGKHIHHPPVAQ